MNAKQIEIDKNHLWHPYTSMINPLPVYPVKATNGVEIELENGEKLIDGMASWWCAIHGYNHPKLNQAILEQSQKMSHVMFGGITHQPAVELAELLLEILPNDLNKIFLADSGSVAVEVAMKMAMQYFFAQKKFQKKEFITVKSGYHGDTFHAMSVCDPETGMHQIYRGSLPIQHFAEAPRCSFTDEWKDDYLKSIKESLEKNHENICGFILEPIVQGAGGMYFYHPQYLREIKELCSKYDILLIFDEIATGFGRTGKMFALEHADISPDIICIGKALTGGYMTLSASITNEKVANTISSNPPFVFMHGPTFMANPLACAVAVASIKTLLSYDWKSKIGFIETILKRELSPISTHKKIKEVRVLGAIGVVETTHAIDMAKIQKRFVELGVWIRPFGKLIYLMPPYTIEEKELVKLCDAIKTVIEEAVFLS